MFTQLDRIETEKMGILITDTELEQPGPHIVYVNAGWCRITGYTKEEVMGKNPRILQGPKTNKDVLLQMKLKMLRREIFQGFTTNYRKDGEEMSLTITVYPVHIDGKEYFLAICRELEKLDNGGDPKVSLFVQDGVFE